MATHPSPGRAVTAVGWSFVGFGLLALVDIVVAAFHGGVDFDLGVVALLIGIGILRRRPAARAWALLVSRISTVAVVCFLGVFALARGPFEFRALGNQIGHPSRAVALAALVPFLMLAIWQQYVLTRPDVRRQFEAGR